MPGHLAFPGGGLEPTDEPGRPGAFARCVSREVAEETGLSLSVDSWLEAGERITPPMFPVRFLTRFFVAGAPSSWEPPDNPPSLEEIESLRFLPARQVLADWSRGDARIPPPVLPILRRLADVERASLDALAGTIAETNAREQEVPRIEFVPGLWMLPVRTRTLPPASHTNVWMPGGRRFVVIDPGSSDEAEVRRLLAVIQRRRELGHGPVAVLLTHGHRDHVGGALAVARALDAPLRGHAAVLGQVERGPGDPPLDPIDDGTELDLDGSTLRVLLTPGHAPGHLAFEVPEQGALIAGDLVSGMSTILIDPETGDMGDYLQSLQRVRSLQCRTLLPGHGPPLPGAALKRLIEHRAVRGQKILDALQAEPVDLPALARAAYTDAPQMPTALIERQTLSHLLHLQRQGLARPVAAPTGAWIAGAGDGPS
jgi:glyoxylase-like metal-dependent hydrolase (beta-lactamase superfamily II)/8-oxo-dGTP pyrophosphatase MutT (NUDIX family)